MAFFKQALARARLIHEALFRELSVADIAAEEEEAPVERDAPEEAPVFVCDGALVPVDDDFVRGFIARRAFGNHESGQA